MIMLIMNVGHMLSLGFEKVLLMYTPSNSGVSDIIDTLVYRTDVYKRQIQRASNTAQESAPPRAVSRVRCTACAQVTNTEACLLYTSRCV